MCSPAKNEGPKDVTEQAKIQSGPKKFVFDFVDEDAKKNESHEQTKKTKNLQLLRYVPVIHGFTEPEDIRESYDSLCDYILDLYSEIRQIFLTEDLDNAKDSIKNLKLESPKGCLEFFKTIAFKWHENLQGEGSKSDLQKTVEAYEKLLQKSELKIRDFIRNEHIYRISFDQFAMRNEEAEKMIADLEAKLQEKTSTIEALGKEKSKLAQTIQQKEDEIRLIKLKKDHVSHQSINQPKNTPQSDSETPLSENARTKNPGIAIKNLKIVLNNHPTLPTDEVCASSLTGEYLKVPQAFKKVQNKSQELKVRSLHKSGTVSDLMPASIKSLKISDIEKLRRDGKASVRSGMQTLTERRKINISGEYHLNNSGKLTDWYSFVNKSASKRASSQAGNFYNTAKVKTPVKARTKRDRSADEDRLYSPSKKVYEDSVQMVVQTEPSEDQTRSYLFPERMERKKLENEYRSQPSKMNKSHIQAATASAKKRKSNVSKIKFPTDFTMDISEKTPELKSFVVSVKHQPSSNSATQRNGSKGPLAERKENKVSKISAPLMNIMLKKLAEQKSISKK